MNQLLEIYKILKENYKGWWILVWSVFLIISFLISSYFIYIPFKLWINQIYTAFLGVTATLSITFIYGINKLKPFFNLVKKYNKQIKNIKKTINQKVAEIKTNEDIAKLNIEKNIESLESLRTVLNEKLSSQNNNKKRLETLLSDIKTGKVLSNFLSDKASDSNYINQLGLLSWIRKDFEKLNEIFINQQEAREKRTKEDDDKNILTIDRIVLYIDDLDRCNTETIVKVLEAIHLLMAHPLFVVVVGVDSRWINNALKTKFKTLLNHKEQKTIATPLDYLEKIFQIPFFLKPMDDIGREKLVNDLANDKNQTIVIPEGNLERDLILEHLTSDNNSLKKENSEEIKVSSPTPLEPKIDEQRPLAERISISEEEISFMKKITKLLKTPRSIKRYVNIYRIIKAHKDYKMTNQYDHSAYMPTMLLLAIVLGNNTNIQDFIDELRISETGTIKSFIETKHKQLLSLIDEDNSKVIHNLPVTSLKSNLDLIIRFSFNSLK